jgi:hypothetical protein
MEHRSGVTAYRSIDRPLNVHLLAPCFSFPGSSFLSSRHSSQHQLYAPFCSPLYALSLPPSASLSLSLLELTPLLRSPELSESMRFDANPASFWETKLHLSSSSSSFPATLSPPQWVGLTPLTSPLWPLPDYVLTFDCYEPSLHSMLLRLNMTLVPISLFFLLCFSSLPPSFLILLVHCRSDHFLTPLCLTTKTILSPRERCCSTLMLVS